MNLEILINSCIKQDRKAQETLYNLYKDVLFVLSLKYCANSAEAEDNLQNSFIEIFTSIKNYKGKGTFEGWIKRITINKAITSYKNSYQLNAVRDNDAVQIEIEENEFNAISIDIILKLVQELPNQYRIVFSLFELDDYSHREIAAMLSITEGTSKSNLHRAKLILKEKILNLDKSRKLNNISNGA